MDNLHAKFKLVLLQLYCKKKKRVVLSRISQPLKYQIHFNIVCHDFTALHLYRQFAGIILKLAPDNQYISSE